MARIMSGWNSRLALVKLFLFLKHPLLLLFQAHNKGINALIMLPEGTLLSGGEKDRKIIAWDSLQNYNKITETKVRSL